MSLVPEQTTVVCAQYGPSDLLCVFQNLLWRNQRERKLQQLLLLLLKPDKMCTLVQQNSFLQITSPETITQLEITALNNTIDDTVWNL